MSVYPGAADDLPTTKTDFTGDPASAPTSAVLTAAEVNLIGSAVEAVQGELGPNPSGASATVAARLDAVDTALGGKLGTTGTAANAAAVGGVTVTGTPTTGQVLKATSSSAATWQTDATGVGGGSVTIDADGTISDGTTTIEVALDADVAALSASTTSALAGKANTSHVHSAADVTSGTLGLARGGTGGTDAATARTSLGLGTAATQAATAFAPVASVTTTLGGVSTATTGTLVAGQMAQVDATAAAAARTLPAANSVAAGTVVGVKKVDGSANAVTVSRAGADTITGTALAQTSRALTLAGESVEFTSDGASVWVITSTDTPSPALTATYAPLPGGTATVGKIPVVTQVSPLQLGWGSSATALAPSVTGDDTAQINAALNAGGGTTPTTVFLKDGVFTVGASGAQANGAALSQPSNTTLVLWNATLRLANGANIPMLMNANPVGIGTTTDSNIGLVGIGYSVIDNNAANNPHSKVTFTTAWKSLPVFYVGVRNMLIRDLVMKNPRAWGFSFQNITQGRVYNISLQCDGSTANQSAITTYGYLKDIVVNGVYGNSKDDGVAFLSYTKSQVDAFGYPVAGVFPGGNMSEITVCNVVGSWGESNAGSAVRFLNGDGATLYDVTVDNVVDNWPDSTWASVEFGDIPVPGIVTTPPGQFDTARVRISGITTRKRWGIAIGQSISATTISDVLLHGGQAEGFVRSLGTYEGQPLRLTDVTFNNISCTSNATGFIFAEAKAGAIWDGVTFRNVRLGNCLNLLKSAGTVTNLTVDGVYIKILNGTMYASTVAETGWIDNVTVGTNAGGLSYYAGTAACGLVMGPSMPPFAAADTAPVARAGSWARGTKVLDGGSAGTAVYVGNGTAWLRVPGADVAGSSVVASTIVSRPTGSSQSFPANANTTATWVTLEEDGLGLGLGTAGVWTIPAGLNGAVLDVSAMLDLNSSGTTSLRILKNGVMQAFSLIAGGSPCSPYVSRPVTVATGDTLSIQLFVVSAASTTTDCPSFAAITRIK